MSNPKHKHVEHKHVVVHKAEVVVPEVVEVKELTPEERNAANVAELQAAISLLQSGQYDSATIAARLVALKEKMEK